MKRTLLFTKQFTLLTRNDLLVVYKVNQKILMNFYETFSFYLSNEIEEDSKIAAPVT